MIDYQFTEYFEKEVLRKRPCLKKEWCIRVIANPLKVGGGGQNIIASGFGERLKM
jgi:hypothetical protein